MPKINPRAVPIITWLRKCFIRNTLERPTTLDMQNRKKPNNFFLVNKNTNVENKKKFKA